MSIVSPFNMKIFCIHVGAGANQAFDTVQMEELQDKVNVNYSDFHVECHLIENPNMVAGINDFVKDHNIGIIAMSNRKHGLLYRIFNESKAHKILYHSSVPLLVFQIK